MYLNAALQKLGGTLSEGAFKGILFYSGCTRGPPPPPPISGTSQRYLGLEVLPDFGAQVNIESVRGPLGLYAQAHHPESCRFTRRRKEVPRNLVSLGAKFHHKC